MSLPGEAVTEEDLHRPPREAWPLARVLSLVLMKMGRTGPPLEPRRKPQAGKSGDPHSQNTDKPLCIDYPKVTSGIRKLSAITYIK